MELNGVLIPLNQLLRAAGIAILLFISAQIGQLIQSENMKWIASFHGVRDEATGLYLACDPVLNQTSILGYQWKCVNETTSRS